MTGKNTPAHFKILPRSEKSCCGPEIKVKTRKFLVQLKSKALCELGKEVEIRRLYLVWMTWVATLGLKSLIPS